MIGPGWYIIATIFVTLVRRLTRYNMPIITLNDHYIQTGLVDATKPLYALNKADLSVTAWLNPSGPASISTTNRAKCQTISLTTTLNIRGKSSPPWVTLREP